MTTLRRLGLTLTFAASAVLAGIWVWNHYLYSPSTRDGRVRADVAIVSPDVPGWVRHLAVRDNQLVKKGDLLFTIDDSRYTVKIHEQEARVERAHNAWKIAQDHYLRRVSIAKSGLVSDEELSTKRSEVQLAKSECDIARSELEAARLDQARTIVRAPADGTVTNLSLRQGNYVRKGEPALSLIEADSFYITGYFGETSLNNIYVGQKATIFLMSDGQPLIGKVSAIGRGIANANTQSNNQLLPQVQQSFNWVRLSQRVPVDIELERVPISTTLIAGTSASVVLDKSGHAE